MTYSFERMSEGGLIIVSVTIDNKSKLRMILDTGCSTLLLTAMLCIYQVMS